MGESCIAPDEKSATSRDTLECRGLEHNEINHYLEFARKAWGKNSPQAKPSFLDWLYSNPNTSGMPKDLIVLVQGDQVVGSNHRMRIPWRVENQRILVPTLHDLYVLSSHRRPLKGQGLMSPGLQIILKGFEGEPHLATFGASPEAEAIYKGMHLPSLQLFWLEKVRSRVAAGAQIAASRLGWRFRKHRQLTSIQTEYRGHQVSRIFSPTTDELLESLALKPDAPSYPDWDLGSFRWRFFHELGPRNILLLARRNSRAVGRSVISVGLRHGCIVGRFVELLFEDWDALDVLLREGENLFSALSVTVCLAVTSSRELSTRLLVSGWKYRRQMLGSHWFSRNKTKGPKDLWISGGAWDFGCDAQIGD